MLTAAEEAYRTLRSMLASGEIAQGRRLSQRKLAARLGCSTVPVLEAMRRLESDGLLVKEPRKMARVRQLSREDLEGLYLVREALEGVGARLAARRISDDEIAELRDLEQHFENAVRSEDADACFQTETELHRFIARCAQCPLLYEELDRLLLIERTTGHGTVALDRQFYLQSHRAILHAIADHDADSAEYLMRKHVRGGCEEALEDFA